MNREEALNRLASRSVGERLQAARYLSRFAHREDVQLLQRAISAEDVYWTKAALERALETAASTTIARPSAEPSGDGAITSREEEAYEEIFAQAVEQTTGRLVHEISPILGIAMLHAEEEVPDYANSKTKRELDRLESLVRAIEQLGRSAAAPKWREFNLGGLIAEVCSRESTGTESIPIETAGPDPLLVIADESLLEIIIRNGLRNAIEATSSTSPSNSVVVTWNRTDSDYRIAILDQGPDLPLEIDRLFEIGKSTKTDHLGMGLALARQAAQSLGGRLTLEPRAEGGARFRFTWPRRTNAA